MRLTIRKKLIFGYAIILLFLVIVGGIGVYQLNNVNNMYRHVMGEQVSNLMLAKELKQEMISQASALRGFAISKDPKYLDSYNTSVKAFNEKVNQLKKGETSKEGTEHLTNISSIYKEYNSVANKAITFNQNDDTEGYITLMNQFSSSIAPKFTTAVEDLVNYENDIMKNTTKTTENKVQEVSFLFMIIVAVSLLIGIGFAFWISHQISSPLKKVVSSLKEVANGNLGIDQVSIRSKDEVGQLADAFNHMVEDLKNVVSEVRESSTSVAASSEQLNASAQESTSASNMIANHIQENAQGFESQLQQFNNVEDSIVNMSKGIDHITLNSEEMLQSANTTKDITKKGEESIHNVVNQMKNIMNSVSHTTNVIQTLGDRSAEISHIVGLITDISNQTNLLALNAAIEAARAGEHGKGFAVVADEVRKLAEESKHSADRITEMISQIQAQINGAISVMEEENQEVGEGLAFTKEAEAAFSKIQTSIDTVTNKVADVTVSLEELDSISQQIVEAIHHVKEVAEKNVAASQEISAGTEENLATLEEVTASAQNLSSLAESLQSLVSRFKVS